jgi:hypothetical protein
MIERDVSNDDVDRALTKCVGCWGPGVKNRWKAMGPDVAGEPLYLVVEIMEQLLVVTMFRGDEE